MNNSTMVFQEILGAYAPAVSIAQNEVEHLIHALYERTGGHFFADVLGGEAYFRSAGFEVAGNTFIFDFAGNRLRFEFLSAQVVKTKKGPVLLIQNKSITPETTESNALFSTLKNGESQFYTADFVLVITPIDEHIDLRKSKKGLYAFNLSYWFKRLQSTENTQVGFLREIWNKIIFFDVCFHLHTTTELHIPSYTDQALLEAIQHYRDEAVTTIVQQIYDFLSYAELNDSDGERLKQLMARYAMFLKSELTLDAYM